MSTPDPGPDDDPETKDEPAPLTREEKREEAHAYRDLAQRLARGNERLPDPPFDEALAHEVEQARTFQKNARNRQTRRLAQKLAQTASVQDFIDALEGRTAELVAERVEEHKNEAWRKRLLAEGDAALTELVSEYPQADTGKLRQQIRQANAEPASKRSKKAATALLREIRALRQG